MNIPAFSPAISSGQAPVRMASAASTAIAHSPELIANAAKYTVGGGYWSRMAAIFSSTIPAGIAGSITGSLISLAEPITGAIVGAVTAIGLAPITFNAWGKSFLSVVPKVVR